MNNVCTVVHGSLTLFLSNDAILDNVRYASRHVINEIMKTELLLDPRVKDLISISYKGPKVELPEIGSVSVDKKGGESGGGMSVMSKVVIGALFSAIVGIVAGFVLFKKVFNAQNCFSSCDGTGVERDFIDETKYYTNPNRLRETRNRTPAGNDNEMQVVSYDIANGLSVINEDSEAMSASASFAMSTMTGHSSHISNLPVGDATMAWNEAGSVASEKTIPTSNKNRTPAFGMVSIG